jgi:VWFA-related protein
MWVRKSTVTLFPFPLSSTVFNFGGKVKKIFLIIIFGLLLSLVSGDIPALSQEKEPETEPLSYKISVNVKLLPVFALDDNGSPVLDLEKDEMELFVNGKPREITYFKRYDFETSTIEKKKEPAPEPKERIVFIILDSMFNSKTGFRRSKEIAQDMVKEGKPGDQFVVFENNIIDGLRHIAGPAGSKEKIMKKIAKLKRPIGKWASQLHSSRALDNNIDFSIITDARLETIAWESLRHNDLQADGMNYRLQVEQFTRVIAQFKYILKTINKPKLVFLISEGMANESFRKAFLGEQMPVEEIRTESDAAIRARRFQSILVQDEPTPQDVNKVYSIHLYRYLKDMVKSINYGGSVIHTINPKRIDDTNDAGVSGEMSLRFLADASGGKYFAGANPDEIAKRIKKTTSAYYEMVFYIDPEMGNQLQLDIKCKREGVRVYTTNYAEGGRYYRDMDPVQKKVFALNVVNGGSWSRNNGKVMRIPYRKTTDKKNRQKDSFTLDVPLPNQMKNKNLEIFLIQRDPKTNQIDMRVVNKKVKNWVKIKIKNNDNKERFFVIIEPVDTYCIYNKA